MNKWERNDGCGFGVLPFWILDLGNFLCAEVLSIPDLATLKCWYKKAKSSAGYDLSELAICTPSYSVIYD
ncbi:MAG: hypothetical protein F6K48_19765 [Okeania sp. SIO3H1]|uniref:hypothetical protein n=1 Tax=Okeania sp. SIO1I7 TaxID=2607772 RepID=UPI0013CAF05D|nr:hypothetical protein [Okeania sp. SIO1I7]NEN91022.1 hypothetical protein [Okeania sp. SIO3H1]NET28822.1 hypothetical protein [Okeania sp. SIO1I7]